MFTFTTIIEAEEFATTAIDALEVAEMQYDVAVIVNAEPAFIEQTERELAAAWAGYCEAMEDLTDTENELLA